MHVEDSNPGITLISTLTTSFHDTGLTTNTTYYYKLFIFNTPGLSTGSNEVTALPSTQDTVPPTVTFTYDAVSQKLTLQDTTGTTTFTYDAVRRIKTVTYPPNKTITYDAVSNCTLMIDPESGRTTYSYDAANNLLTFDGSNGSTNNGFTVSWTEPNLNKRR